MGYKEFKKPAFKRKSGDVVLTRSLPEPGLENLKYPVFCFRNLHKDYNVDRCVVRANKNFVKALVKKLKQLSDTNWNDLKLSHMGPEQINVGSLKVPLPSNKPKDLGYVLSFYFAGDQGRLIGHKSGDVFHIYYIDTDLSVYTH